MSLLEEIRKGKQLRKVPESEKNDRSTLSAAIKSKANPGPVATAPSAGPCAPPDSSTNRAPGPPDIAAQLGNLFANGVPRLRGRTMDSAGSQPPPPTASMSRLRAPPPPPPPGVPSYAPKGAPPPPPPGPPPMTTPSFSRSFSFPIQRSDDAQPTDVSPYNPMRRQQTYDPGTRLKARNGVSSGGQVPSRTMSSYNSVPRPLQNGVPGTGSTRASKQFAPVAQAPSSNGYPSVIRNRSSTLDAPAPFTQPNLGVSSVPRPPPLVLPPATAAAPIPPPPPPPARRKNSTNQRSQRAGCSSNEQGVPMERAANAAPKVIHINSPGARTNGAPPTAGVKTHPPPPPPPVGAPRPPTVTAFSVDFGQRFQFLSDAELPPPPEAYKGPHTYRIGANRTAPRPPPPVPSGTAVHY